MSTQGEREVRASSVRPDTSTRFRKWAARRTRQFLVAVLALSCLLALVAAVAWLRRATCLIGLPDVGDPFNVAAMYAEQVPDDRNAFVYFRRAMAKLRPLPEVAENSFDPILIDPSGWAKAAPWARTWAESNHEALDLFRTGAEQADGWAHPVGKETAFNYDTLWLQPIVRLVFFEASRLEERGDMPGAWAWYRSLLGMHAHFMRRGAGFQRAIANLYGKDLRGRVQIWAADPKTRTIDLRRALDDVIAYEPRPEWEASALKVDYLLTRRELDQPGQVLIQGDSDEQKYEIAGEPLPPNLAHLVYAIHRFLINEPERSRRVLRLAFASWLAHVEVPEERGRKPAVRVRLKNNSADPGVFLYAAGPTAPAAARALPPQKLAEWLVTAPDARLLQGQWLWSSLASGERRRHRELLILLAEELYRREHGRPPVSEKDLVGPYLERLPDDDASDLDDLDAPTVEVSENAR
jgi:hypothetical protein